MQENGYKSTFYYETGCAESEFRVKTGTGSTFSCHFGSESAKFREKRRRNVGIAVRRNRALACVFVRGVGYRPEVDRRGPAAGAPGPDAANFSRLLRVVREILSFEVALTEFGRKISLKRTKSKNTLKAIKHQRQMKSE